MCRPRHHEPNTTHLGSNGRRMREISRSVQNDKQAKKCVDCTVRTDADVAGCTTRGRVVQHVAWSYDTWQAVMWTIGI